MVTFSVMSGQDGKRGIAATPPLRGMDTSDLFVTSVFAFKSRPRFCLWESRRVSDSDAYYAVQVSEPQVGATLSFDRVFVAQFLVAVSSRS